MITKTIPQRTLGKEVSLNGVGLHTGKKVKLTFKPAPVNTGFVFLRTDIEPSFEIPADVQYVKTTDRGTTLEKDGIKIQTSEHVLAALVGMQIDNCFISMNAPESPIMDVFPNFTGEEEDAERVEEFMRLKDSVPFQNNEDEALANEDALVAE